MVPTIAQVIHTFPFHEGPIDEYIKFNILIYLLQVYIHYIRIQSDNCLVISSSVIRASDTQYPSVVVYST